MRSMMTAIAAGFIVLCSASARAEPGDAVGSATKVVNRIAAEFQQSTRDLSTGDGVRQDETIAAEANALAEIKLNDDTKLAIGPGARLKLDKFVYDPDKSGGAISVDLLKGAFRFVTGKAAKQNYLIRSPNASISVRGTIFDVYVDAAGGMWLLLHEGAIEVCNAAGTCRVLSNPCSAMRVGGDGGVGEPGTLNRQQRGLDTDFATAFPFILNPPDFDQVVRFTRASIETGSCAGPQNEPPGLQRADVIPEYNPAPPRQNQPPANQNPQDNADEPPVQNTGPLPTIPGIGLPIYIRVDINVNTSNEPPRVEEEGLTVGDKPEILRSVPVSSPVTLPVDALTESLGSRGSFGLGVGLRLPGGIRFEVTGDRRHQTGVSINALQTTDIVSPPIAFSAYTDVEVTTKERTSIDGGVFMANAYLDIPLTGPLSAYVGGGVGFAWTMFERENQTSAYAIGAGRALLYTQTVNETDHDASLAAAVAAGLAYKVSNLVEVEFGYRFVHIGAADGAIEQAGNTSTLSLDDANQHEVRIGLRLSAF